MNGIDAIAKKYNLPVIKVPIEYVYLINNNSNNNNNDKKENKYEVSEVEKNKIKEMIKESETNSTKEDIITQMKWKLISYISKEEEGVDKVMLGTNASRTAANLVSFTCKGRGFALPNYLSTSYSLNDVTFIYPMRDFLAKEVGIYNHLHKIIPVNVITLHTKTNTKWSIDHLSQHFIESLQVEFYHTVHTLLKSSSKLYTPSSSIQIHCSLCSKYVIFILLYFILY